MNRLELEVLFGSDFEDRVQPMLAAHYADLVDALWDWFDTPTRRPNLQIVHSAFARPLMSNGESGHHLVYDQYLGQVFNRLTRLEISDAPAPAVDAYTFRLFGQRNLIRGRTREALAMALLSGSASKKADAEWSDSESDQQHSLRTMLTHMQESFALAHELVHALLTTNEGEPLRASYRPIVESWQNGMTEALADPQHLQGIETELNSEEMTALARRGHTPAERTEQPLDAERFATRAQHLVSMIDREPIFDEAICDYFGALAAASLAPSTTALSFAASRLGLLHLRFIQFLDRAVDEPIESLRVDEDLEQSTIRNSLLNYALARTLIDSDNEAVAAEYNLITEQLTHAHNAVIFDQTASRVDLHGLARDLAANIDDRSDSTGSDMHDLRNRLGLVPVPPISLRAATELLGRRNELSRTVIDEAVARNPD